MIVGNDEIRNGALFDNAVDRPVPGRRGDDTASPTSQQAGHPIQNQWIVIDHNDKLLLELIDGCRRCADGLNSSSG